MSSQPSAKRTDVSSTVLSSTGINASAFIKLPDENSIPFHKKYARGMKLGSGAYGEVYCCVEKQTHADRAVKIIPLKKLGHGRDAKSDQKIYEEFYNEVRLLRSLDHPNIMKIYDCGKDDDLCYLVTDVYVGGELFDEIIRREKFSEDAAAYVIKQVLSGVKYLHSMNIVHRDLKPENLLLTNNTKNKQGKESLEDEFSIKIIDFGLSTLMRNADESLKDRVGSAYYIAPEILKRNYGPACDIWSVGVILFVLLSGYPPFSGEDDAEIIANVASGKYSMDPAFWGKISNEAKDLVRRMMELDPRRRLTAAECLDHPWFKKVLANNQATISHKPLMVALRNMRAYSGNQSLLKAATLLLGSKLTTQAETAELTKVFRSLDLNHDGRLDRDELIAGYKTLIEARGFCAKLFSASDIVHEVDAVLAKVDFDHNGYIDYSEFISVAMDRSKLFSKERLRAAFQTFDADGSGRIDLSELREYLECSDSEWDVLLEKYDVDGDGTIDVDEFIAMMESQLLQSKPKRQPESH